MSYEASEIMALMLPTIALLVVLVAVVLSAKKLLPDGYRWETAFRDLLENNLGDRK